MDREEYKACGFPIMTRDRGEVRINTAAYADDLILYSDTGDGIQKFLRLLAMFFNYTGIKINVKKCVSLVELWDGDRQDEPKYLACEPFDGTAEDGSLKWGSRADSDGDFFPVSGDHDCVQQRG
jgi:hypothetical protein